MTNLIISISLLLVFIGSILIFRYKQSKVYTKEEDNSNESKYNYTMDITDTSYILTRPKRVFNIKMKSIKNIEQCYPIAKQLESNILEFEDKNNLVKLAKDNNLELEYNVEFGKVKTITARFIYFNADGTQKVIKVVTNTDRIDLSIKLKTIIEFIKTNPIQSVRTVGGWLKVINEK